MSMTFNERVRMIWKEKRPDIKSVRNLEEHIGLSNGTIASWKKSSPSQAKIEQVASFFGVSVDYLLGNTDDMHANKKSTAKDTVDVEKDPTILSLDGIEITDEYRQFIIDQIRTIRKMRGDDK